MKTILIISALLIFVSCGKKSSNEDVSEAFNEANDTLEFLTVDNNDRLGLKMGHFSSGRVEIIEVAFYYNYRMETGTYPPIYALESNLHPSKVKKIIKDPEHNLFKCRENRMRIDEFEVGCFRGEWF